jgi:hypothetical protein
MAVKAYNNFTPKTEVILLQSRRSVPVADVTLIDPNNNLCIYDGEWLIEDASGKLVRASTIGSVGNAATKPLVLVAMFLLAIFFTAFGTAIAVRMTDMQSFPLIMNFIMMPLFFLSGALFPIEGLSSVLSFVVKANPLSYGLDALRGLLIGHYQFSLGLDTLVMLIGSALFLYIAGTFKC